MNRFNQTLMAFLLAALAGSGAVSPARADQGTSLVRHDDLDLSKPADRRVLQIRMNQAANALCLNPTGPAPGVTVDATCKSDAVQAARAQLHELNAKRELAATASGPSLGSAD